MAEKQETQTDSIKPQSVYKDILYAYYDRIFPFQEMYNWLSHGNAQTFYHREFSFSIDSIYLRYQCFKNAQEFKQAVLKLVPTKIDIGPVYNVAPKEQHSVAKFEPKCKEFVLDIDISDYDNIRICGCKEAKTCSKCWKLMHCAMKVLDHLLDDVFGYDNRMWVFSGRRGIHCWVSDASVLHLDNPARSAIIEFMEIYRGTETQSKKVLLPKVPHPTFARDSKIYNICEDYFLRIYGDEFDIFDEDTHWNLLLNTIPDEYASKIVKEVLEEQKEKDRDYKEKWEAIKKRLIKEKRSSAILDMVYSLTYPRVDVNVSKGLNHLLKSPFCVHPSTGYVCVPIGVDDEFYPDQCPNVHQLFEKDDYQMKMKPFKNKLNEYVKKMRSENDDAMDF